MIQPSTRDGWLLWIAIVAIAQMRKSDRVRETSGPGTGSPPALDS
jgi:hypothetical protein